MINDFLLTIQKFPKRGISLAKSTLRYLMRVSQSFLNIIIDVNRLELFGCTRSEAPPLPIRSDLNIKKLTHEDLMALASDSGRFSEQARLYHVKRGIETAYGAYRKGELVHMSWVYSAAEYSKEPFSRLILKDSEVEIVNCFTLAKYRGLGIYPYMIQFLSNLLFQNGIEHIYMLAEHKNLASQRGIRKAGLRHLGQVIYIRIPATSKKSIYYRRYQN